MYMQGATMMEEVDEGVLICGGKDELIM